jgi:hypothetical protein
MFKQGLITCCPICKNENKAEEKKIGLSKEFGVPFYRCNICQHTSARDLRHGIKNDSIPSNKSRCRKYSDLIAGNAASINAWSSGSAEPSILEIGPGDYDLCDRLVSKGVKEVSSMDVGINFMNNGDPSIKKWCVKIPERPEEVFNVSSEMEKIINKSQNYDLIISIHSLEHSPDPITMVQLIDLHSGHFIIEVPDGGASGVERDTVCAIDCPGPFPLIPDNKKQGDVKRKGYLVGGHYQIFNVDSLEYIARNILEKNRTYYIGKSISSKLGICLTTLAGMVREIYKEVKV